MAADMLSVDTFYGLIRFDESLECIEETLGLTTNVVIGGVTGVLELPSKAHWNEKNSSDPLHVPLTPPTSAANWKEGDRNMVWGYPTQYPRGQSAIEKALLTFEFSQDQMHAQATSVHKGFAHWYKLFQQYFQLITKQRSFALVEREQYPDQLDLFRWGSDGKADRPYERLMQSVNLYSSDSDVLLKPDQFVQICKLASSSQTPSLHYQIQLEAYKAMRNGDYRQAIIETGTAAELGLVQAVREAMATSSSPFVNALLRKFQTLNGKLELSRLAGVSIPSTDYQRRLVDPRNNVAHRGVFASRTEALDAIQSTDELLGAICPSFNDDSGAGMRGNGNAVAPASPV